jgi:hypothetical protein
MLFLSTLIVSPLLRLTLREKGQRIKRMILGGGGFNIYIYMSVIMIILNTVSHSNMIYEMYMYEKLLAIEQTPDPIITIKSSPLAG